MVVNNSWIRPYLLGGGVVFGVPLDCHENISAFLLDVISWAPCLSSIGRMVAQQTSAATWGRSVTASLVIRCAIVLAWYKPNTQGENSKTQVVCIYMSLSILVHWCYLQRLEPFGCLFQGSVSVWVVPRDFSVGSPCSYLPISGSSKFFHSKECSWFTPGSSKPLAPEKLEIPRTNLPKPTSARFF